MHTRPAKYSSTLAINALWCLLIALALLAFPIVARQIRLQTDIAPKRAQVTPLLLATDPQPATGAVLVSVTDSPQNSP